MAVKKIMDIPSENVYGGIKTSRKVLIGSDEAPNFAMRKFKIEPGGKIPKHKNSVEHEQYVLRGTARIGIGDQIYEVSKDDVIFIPAGVPHWYEVIGNKAFVFLCSVPNKEDNMEFIE
jgi:quercetin dioxygenase-like cupin family protein